MTFNQRHVQRYTVSSKSHPDDQSYTENGLETDELKTLSAVTEPPGINLPLLESQLNQISIGVTRLAWASHGGT